MGFVMQEVEDGDWKCAKTPAFSSGYSGKVLKHTAEFLRPGWQCFSF